MAHCQVRTTVLKLVESRSLSHASDLSVACEQLTLERHKMMVVGGMKSVQQASGQLINCLNAQGFESLPLYELNICKKMLTQVTTVSLSLPSTVL